MGALLEARSAYTKIESMRVSLLGMHTWISRESGRGTAVPSMVPRDKAYLPSIRISDSR